MKHAIALVPVIMCSSALAASQSQSWIRQFGTSANDGASAAAPAAGGGVFVSGPTFEALGGPSAGGEDVWLARYDDAGNQVWIRQLGTGGYEAPLAACSDGAVGVYVCGFTDGNLGATNAGASDGWFARYDGAGNLVSIRQLGTSADDTAWSVAPDGTGGVFVCGNTLGSLAAPSAGSDDVWLARYDGGGNQTWTRQFGAAGSDAAFVAAADASGGVYIAGETTSSLGAPNAGNADAWIARYDSAGNRLWIRQLGTSAVEFPRAATSDGAGGIYLSGFSNGALGGANAGAGDAWLARYDSSGNQLWIRQFGTSSDEHASGVALAGSSVYVSGYTDGDLAATNAGAGDAWLSSFDANGNQTWIVQFGSSATEEAHSLAPDGTGGVYATGATMGDLGGANSGSGDAWIARYSAPTSTTYCTAGTTTHGCVATIGATGTPSATASSGFTLGVSSVEGQKQALIYYGIDNSAFTPVAWGTSSSFLCVKPPTQRTPPQSSGGTLNQCDGALSIDWNAFRAANPGALGSPFGAGQHVFAQAWFRDPPSAKHTALSDALEFVVQP